MSFLRYRHSPLGTAWKIAKVRCGAAPVPLAVNLVLTYRCNLRCIYCDVARDAAAEMDTPTICRLVDEIAAAGTERLGLGGGEPMLRADIGAIVDHAKKRGLTVSLCSNGLRVAERIAELAGLDFLAISLDGPEDIHDQARGKGSFARAIEAIRAARAAGIEVWTTTVLTRLNIGRIAETLDLASRLGARASVLPVMAESLGSRNAQHLQPDRREFVAAMEQLLRERSRAGTALATSRELLRFYRDRWGEPHAGAGTGARHGGTLACRAGRLFCSIAPDGRLYPCNYLQHAQPGPSTLASGFAAALQCLEAPDCAGCWCDSFIESNLIFALRPGAVLHALALLASPPAAVNP